MACFGPRCLNNPQDTLIVLMKLYKESILRVAIIIRPFCRGLSRIHLTMHDRRQENPGLSVDHHLVGRVTSMTTQEQHPAQLTTTAGACSRVRELKLSAGLSFRLASGGEISKPRSPTRASPAGLFVDFWELSLHNRTGFRTFVTATALGIDVVAHVEYVLYVEIDYLTVHRKHSSIEVLHFELAHFRSCYFSSGIYRVRSSVCSASVAGRNNSERPRAISTQHGLPGAFVACQDRLPPVA